MRCLLQNQKCDKILVVNDSPTLNALLKIILEAEGFSVVITETGSDGLEEAEKTQYHLILLDYVLPDIGGLDVCRELRKRKLTENVPIAFISGKDEAEISEKIKEAGADAYIHPPYMGKVFINRINSIISTENHG